MRENSLLLNKYWNDLFTGESTQVKLMNHEILIIDLQHEKKVTMSWENSKSEISQHICAEQLAFKQPVCINLHFYYFFHRK